MTAVPGEVLDAIEAATGERPAGAGMPVAGGDINHAVRLGECFVKLNDPGYAAMFEAEAEGLAELAAARGGPRVPAVVARGVAGGRAYLVLEWIDFGQPRRNGWHRMGEAVAAMHATTAERFGWHRDNTIGTTSQPNAWMTDWVAFFAERRLGHQLALAAEQGAPTGLIRDGERLRDGLGGLFSGYQPVPSLLHGDLWGGNAAFDGDGAPVIYDPAVHYGDRECDLAMTELFGGFPADFHAAYDAVWPRDAGYPVRRTLYQLYHLLNHFNLFGGGFARSAHDAVRRLLSEIG
ncbi:hypothetical protein KBTX_01145 [wastewater metagenome]|uniref:Fructosamine kinase n=3 Tax=root TaxID=1 RepID=A0A5B8R7Y2_9ZZZZ|nr:fructosamine kinase family protein [Arhodomonas aquaeolei]QEA04836.1 hypothetical protein KBTEX_01145 [uncultured organism]